MRANLKVMAAIYSLRPRPDDCVTVFWYDGYGAQTGAHIGTRSLPTAGMTGARVHIAMLCPCQVLYDQTCQVISLHTQAPLVCAC